MMVELAFYAALILAAIIDLKTKIIPWQIPVFILFLPLFVSEWSILEGLYGLLLVGGTLYIPTLFKPRCFGGGDIKLAAACGWALCAQRGILGLLLSLIFSLLPIFWCKIRKYKIEYIPFAPSMAVGFILGAIIC